MRRHIGMMLLLLATGCDDLQVEGELGRGEFNYICGNPGDAACDGTSDIVGFEFDRSVRPVVVGGTFDLDFEGDDDIDVRPAVLDIVDASGSGFVFNDAGLMDFLALDAEGNLVDFTAMTSEFADELSIFFGGRQVNTVALRRFREEEIAAAPLFGGEPLGGGLDYDWSISGGGVDLVSAGRGNVVIVEVSEFDANATLTVTTGALSASVTITAED